MPFPGFTACGGVCIDADVNVDCDDVGVLR